MKRKRSSYTPQNNKFMKATEASKFLGLTITEFLDGHKEGTIPKSVFMGYGYRWAVSNLVAFKKNSEGS